MAYFMLTSDAGLTARVPKNTVFSNDISLIDAGLSFIMAQL